MNDTPQSGSKPPSSAFAPFRHEIFRSVWIATLISSFGGMIQGVGAAWMMVALGASAQMVTLVQASITLPIVMLALVAGALADAFDRRKLMLVAQTFMFAISTILAVCAYLDLITPWSLLLFTFLIGCGAALNAPAWQASVGAMVPRQDVSSAVSMNSMGFNLARSVGPAIGGLNVWLAWLAALSLGLLATGGVGLGIDRLGDRPEQTTIRAFEDAPPPIIRAASTKLTVHRPNIDDDRPSPGSAPAISLAAVMHLSFPATVSVLSLVLSAPITERAISPYAARAPPASII